MGIKPEFNDVPQDISNVYKIDTYSYQNENLFMIVNCMTLYCRILPICSQKSFDDYIRFSFQISRDSLKYCKYSNRGVTGSINNMKFIITHSANSNRKFELSMQEEFINRTTFNHIGGKTPNKMKAELTKR